MNENMSEIQHQTADGEPALNGKEPEVLSELVALAEDNRTLRTWPAEAANKAAGLLSEALFGRGAAGPDALRNAMSLMQDLPITVVESSIATHWPNLDQERKNLFLLELTRHNSSKWLTRQAAIAEKVARVDRQAAAHILHSFVSGGKAHKDGEGFWPNLSEEKRKLLQNRFLLSEEGWVYFQVDDEGMARSLLAAFIEAASDPQVVKKAKSKRTLYDFARWAAAVQKPLGLVGQERAEIRSRITELTNQLPTDEWKNAVKTLMNADDGQVALNTGATNQRASVTSHVQPLTRIEQEGSPNAPDAVNDTSLPTTSQMLIPGQASGPTDFAKTLAERSREWASRWRSAIDSFANELSTTQEFASLAERLAAAVADLEREKSGLEEELYQTKRKSEGIQSDNAAREARLSATLDDLDKARSTAESLGAQLGKVRSELEGERAARAKERRALEEDAVRRVEVKLNGLKWKLAESLRPVFDNKRNTDDQEPSPRLAEFLRHWFDELEARLGAAGVKLRDEG